MIILPFHLIEDNSLLTHVMVGYNNNQPSSLGILLTYWNLRIRMLTKSPHDINRWLSGAIRILAEQTKKIKIIHSVLMMMTDRHSIQLTSNHMDFDCARINEIHE